jgi:hypothetical protein
MESRGPNRPIRTGSASTCAGFRNRFPAFPVSGVKRPAPVAVGTGGCVVFVVSWSSGEVRLIGGGREGNNSSISGTAPEEANNVNECRG